MTAVEMMIAARLAQHYEDARLPHDALDTAESDVPYTLKRTVPQLWQALSDVYTLKRTVPQLWQALLDTDRTPRQIGDWWYKFIVGWRRSRMSLRNYAGRVLRVAGHRR